MLDRTALSGGIQEINDYFALDPFVQMHSDEIFVDCGAWRGDVVEQYIKKKTGKVVFERYEANNGQGSKFQISDSENEGNSRIISLDEYLAEPYSFLKADIESFEYQMLMGAEKGIKNNRLFLTICLYYNEVDLYTILLMVKSMVPEYKIVVRHHSDTLVGTVLYAWV